MAGLRHCGDRAAAPRRSPVTAGTFERLARAGTRLLLRSPVRAATLTLLRAGVRVRPDVRLFSAPAFYAGEVLSETKGPLEGRLKSGGRIVLLPSDAVHRHIYFYGEWEPATTRFLRSIARPGWTFVDVGANAGYYSLLAADLGGPSSQVHAFEPNPALVELLEASAAQVPCIRVVAAACGAEAGEAQLTLSSDRSNSGLASLRPSRPGPATLTVSVETLDRYCSQRGLAPDVVKIDVEGYEPEVLAGASRLLSDRVPRHIVCEVVPERWSPQPLFGRISGHGYAVRSLTVDGRLRPYREELYQNVVFVRE